MSIREVLDQLAEPRHVGEIHTSEAAYRKLKRMVVTAMAVVALSPLVIMTLVSFTQYGQAFRAEAMEPISRLTLNTKRTLELFLSERRSALAFLVLDRTFEQLCGRDELSRVMKNMNRSLSLGNLVDLGLVNAAGDQVCYAGAFDLAGKNYADQEWFHEVARRGVYVSDVFLGYRNMPHFVIATRHERSDGSFYVLRATIDSQMLAEQLLTSGMQPTDDVFLINREGILQSPSRHFGAILAASPLGVPPYSHSVEVVEQRDEKGRPIVVGYAYVENSPYILMFIKRSEDVMGKWVVLRRELLGLVVISAALILGVILWGSTLFVNQIREANRRRAALLHQVEYASKLASIGRLAAGVAHEVNNPLAVINEKAGLIRDLVSLDEGFPKRDKLLSLVDSVLKSVDRCSKVTRRLLGFAKHMDVQNETLDLHGVLKEVFDFLGREAEYRNIQVRFDVEEGLPTIVSDRGQLQQVFLNLLNNAFAAVSDGGHINIAIARQGKSEVSVTIEDDGVGISPENLKRIFEPFFTTKAGSGTGLGLSITYGIVQKLGGRVHVESTVGSGARFAVFLPITRKA